MPTVVASGKDTFARATAHGTRRWSFLGGFGVALIAIIISALLQNQASRL